MITILQGRSLIAALWTAALLAQSGGAPPGLEQAVTLARERRYAEAEQALRGITMPTLPAQRIAFHRLKAAIASGLGHAGEAADEIEAALAVDPENQGLLLATGVAELHAGRLDRALVHSRQAARQAAGDAQAQELIGDIEEQRGDFVEAAKAYQAAVALAPGNEEYRIRLALELVQHYTFEPAVSVLRDALPQFPRSARMRALLGIAEYAAGQSAEAVASLTDAVELDPTLEQAWAYLASVVLESTGAPPAKSAEAICRWNEVVCGAVELRQARQQGDDTLRRAAMAKLRKAAPSHAMARCELGRAYEWSAEWADARREMEACVKMQPAAQNHYRLGLIYRALQLDDLARAQMKLREAAMAKSATETARRQEAVRAFRLGISADAPKNQ